MVDLIEGPGLGQVPHHLTDEERVAVGLGGQRIAQRDRFLGHPVAGRCLEQGEEVLVSEASQRVALDPRLPVQRGKGLRERMIGLEVRVAEGPDHEQPNGASTVTTWRKSWIVGRSAHCRSSNTSTSGALADMRASTSTTAPNSRCRSDSASLHEL